MMQKRKRPAGFHPTPVLLAAAVASLAHAAPATAQDSGIAPWQLSFQAPASRVMEYIVWFGNFTFVIIALIVILVLGLLGWCIVRFSARANPKPSKVTHNTAIELIWTIVPILILVLIAVPSFRLLYAQFDPGKIYEDFDPRETKFLTVKATGYQWYWGYEYGTDDDSASFGLDGEISFDAIMLGDDERGENDPRLLAVDNPLVVPVGTFVRMQVTAADVIHAFAVPAFGIKIDAVPGRLNETYFRADREGIYYGQCSELCGKDHAFMPIAVRVVSADQFARWAAAAGDDLEAANAQLARLIENDNGKIETAAR